MTFIVYYTDRVQPDSSFVNRAWYNGVSRVLYLELHGVVYSYHDVTYPTFHALVESDSPGTFYRNNIVGRFSGSRLGPVSDLTEVAESQSTVNQVQFANGGRTEISTPALTEKPRVKLATVTEAKTPEYAYTLHFVIDTEDAVSDERSHTLKATSLDDAIEQMFELGALLNQNLVLKGASVRFD